MNTKVATLISALALVFLSAVARGDSKWIGQGEEYSPDGALLGKYSVEVVIANTSEQTVHSTTTISAEGNAPRIIEQTLEMKGTSWSETSTLGKGGGACYGGQMCEDYLVGSDDLAYATTIAMDSSNSRRILTVVLKKGRAIKVLHENISKVD